LIWTIVALLVIFTLAMMFRRRRLFV
jgi:hypothetical protein